MAGRRFYIEFRGAKSGIRNKKQGVPHEDILSPILFNTYVREIPPPPLQTIPVSYTDDFVIIIAGRRIKNFKERMNVLASLHFFPLQNPP